MIRNVLSLVLVLVLTAVLGFPAGAAQSRSGTSVVTVEGIITAINTGRSWLTIQLLTPEHRRVVGSDRVTVQVERDTSIHAAEPGGGERLRAAQLRDLRVGDRVQVDLVRLNTGQFIAVRVILLVIIQPRPAPTELFRDQRGQALEIQGMVIERGNRSLRIRQNNGNARSVVVTATTDITGRVNSFQEIRVGDIVVVRGVVIADGSVVARWIEVLRHTAEADTVVGTIIVVNTGGFLVLSSGLPVSVSDTTRFMSCNRGRSFGDLRVGLPITVIGFPISTGGVVVAIQALVILY